MGDSVIKEYEQLSSELEADLFDITDIEQIIQNTLKVSQIFINNFPLKDYVECHSMSLSYFSSLKKHLSKRNLFSQEYLDEGFKMAFRSELLIPRLYTALMLCCTSDNEENLNTLMQCLMSVTNPMRGLLLRFTAITFFPTKSKIFISFAKENYDEMLYLLQRFLRIYPDAISQVSDWITPNISITFFICKDSDDLFVHFFEKAANFENPEIAVNLVACIEQNIEKQMLINHFEDFQKFINKSELVEKTSIVTENIIRHCGSAKDAFSFIQAIKFRNDFAMLLTQIAIDQKDFETIKQCASLWPQEDVFNLIFSTCGHNKFVFLVPSIQNGAEISMTFVKTATAEVMPSALRKVLENEMIKRTQSMDELITQFTCQNNLTNSFINEVFAPPFVAHGEHMLKSLVFQALREGIEHDFIVNLIKTSEFVSPETKVSLLCQSLERDQVSELIPFISTTRAMEIFLVNFFSFDVMKEHAPILCKLCKTKHLKLFCAQAFAISGFDQEAAELFSSVFKNFQTVSIKETIDLYMEIISSIAAVYKKSPLSETIARNLFDECVQISKNIKESIFPIATPEYCRKWIRLAKSISKIIPDLQYDKFIEFITPSE